MKFKLPLLTDPMLTLSRWGKELRSSSFLTTEEDTDAGTVELSFTDVNHATVGALVWTSRYYRIGDLYRYSFAAQVTPAADTQYLFFNLPDFAPQYEGAVAGQREPIGSGFGASIATVLFATRDATVNTNEGRLEASSGVFTGASLNLLFVSGVFVRG